MKTITRNLMTAICLMTVMSVKQFANAGEGGSSGSGNGGEGFSIQSISEENPGLSKYEVLLEAFKRSEGRVPEAVLELVSLPSGGTISKRKASGIEIHKDLSTSEESLTKLETGIQFQSDGGVSLGPIFNNQIANINLWVTSITGRGKAKITTKGLEAIVNSYPRSGYDKKCEYRQLSKKEIVALCNLIRTNLGIPEEINNSKSMVYYWE